MAVQLLEEEMDKVVGNRCCYWEDNHHLRPHIDLAEVLQPGRVSYFRENEEVCKSREYCHSGRVEPFLEEGTGRDQMTR